MIRCFFLWHLTQSTYQMQGSVASEKSHKQIRVHDAVLREMLKSLMHLKEIDF